MGNSTSLPSKEAIATTTATATAIATATAVKDAAASSTIATRDSREDDDANGVPDASVSSNASSSSSSSDDDDNEEDVSPPLQQQQHQHTTPYDDHDDEEECPINPYPVEEVIRRPIPSKDQQVSCISGGRKGNKATAASFSSSSECYRLSIFQPKSSPFTVLDTDESAKGVEDDSLTTARPRTATTDTCFPRTSSRLMLPDRSSTNANTSQHGSSTNLPSTSTNAAAALSFQYCREAVSETFSLNNEDCSSYYPTNGYAGRSTSSLLGCVNSPLLPRSNNSWANLVGLEDVRELNYTQDELQMVNGDLPTPASDLTIPRDYWIVTTAALPWMTGTAVNPLLRAAYLSQRNRKLLEQQRQQQGDDTTPSISKTTVTLVLPWLEVAEDRLALYGKNWEDATPEIQEDYIRTWLKDSAQMPQEASPETGGIAIQWYPSRYHQALSSIFAMGDLCELIPSQTSNMICILEEPEHVNCYRAPGRESWRDKFPHVIGIVHTNYKAYAQNHYSGLLTGPLVGALSSLMVRAYCDKVVKLSPVLQSYAPYKEVVSNVHGIRQEFLQVSQNPKASRIYFIGKLLWAKGLDKLLELEASYRKATGFYFAIDIYGSGPHENEIEKSFLGQDYFSPPPFLLSSTATTNKNKKSLTHSPSSLTDPSTPPTSRNDPTATINDDSAAKRYWRRFRQPIPARFLGRKDHAQVGMTGEYKIFVNPSITEVLCTTTAEAVAMGVWVIIPKHSSNEFFLPFGNCLQYSNRKEFVELLQYCQSHDPPAWCNIDDRSSESMYGALSWQSATQRLIDTAFLSRRDARRCERLQPKDRNIQEWHYALGRGTRGDVLRKVLGGGPVADQSQYCTGSTRPVAAAVSPSNAATYTGSVSPTAISAGAEAEALREMFPEEIDGTIDDKDPFEYRDVRPETTVRPTAAAAASLSHM